MAIIGNRGAYATWTKKRVREMDSALKSLEANAERLKSEFTAKGDRMIADLKKQRDQFARDLRKSAKTNARTATRKKAELEAQWKRFDARVQDYFKTVENRFAPRHTAFQRITAAQARAWRKAMRALHQA